MSRWTLRFCDPNLEARYLAEREPVARQLCLLYTAISIVGWGAFSWWDWVFVPAHFAGMSALRHGIGTSGMLIGIVALWLSPPEAIGRVDKATIFGGGSVLVSTLAMHASYTTETVTAFFAGLSIIVLFQHACLTSRVVLSTPLTCAAVVGYFVIAILRQLPSATIVNNGTWLVTAEILAFFINHTIERLQRTTWAQRLAIDEERARSDQLLLNILPPQIATRLKAGESPIADRVEVVTVLFGDIVGFTSLSQQKTPEELVSMLDAMFRQLDAIASAHGLEKIKTIGDAYMAVGGLLDGRLDHVEQAARAAIEMRDMVTRFDSGGARLSMRLGLHTGPVVAGVIGTHKFSYDVWGDTVNTASRMESHGVPGEVHVSDEVARVLSGKFLLSSRGEIEVKGKGRMSTWLLAGEEGRISDSTTE